MTTTLEDILRRQVELLITKHEGGSAGVSAGIISDLALEVARRKGAPQ